MSLSSLDFKARRRNLVERVNEELRQHFIQGDEHSKRFICRQALLGIWQDESRLHTLLGPNSISPQDIRRVQRECVAILSILTYIRAIKTIGRFHAILYTDEINDTNLPLQDGEIRQLLSLEPELFFLFNDYQWAFCPAEIHCDRDPPLQLIDARRRLPFLSTPKLIGSGGFGVVELVKVAPRYLKLSRGADFEYPYKVACKRFEGVRKLQDFETELANLQNLKSSLTNQAHILQHLTTISHGPQYYILFPYAELGDLDQFLLDGAGLYDFRQRFPLIAPHSTPDNYKPLLYQCWALASALDWLHNGIKIKTRDIKCAHMDLKPDNILIMKDSSSTVGKWVISDFGISVAEHDRHSRAHALSIRDLYREVTIDRLAVPQLGTYQPPEGIHMKGDSIETEGAGRRSDVWSFGCVFSEVLAWAIGRRREVEEFAYSRARRGQKDAFWEEITPNTRSPGKKEFRLCDAVARWLNDLQNQRYSTDPVVRLWAQKLAREILIVSKADRPSAAKLEKIVGGLYNACEMLTTCDMQESGLPLLQRYEPPELVVTPACGTGISPDISSPSLSTTGTRSGSSTFSQPPTPSTPVDPTYGHTVLPHSSSGILAAAISRSKVQDTVPVAMIYTNRIEIIQISISHSGSHACRTKLLRDEWRSGSVGVAIEGRYFAAWGDCKKSMKRRVYIGDTTSDPMSMLPSDIGFISSVAISAQGILALVCDKEILLRSQTSQFETQCLFSERELDQTFTQAIFNDQGSMLFAWAIGSRQESLYVWRIEENNPSSLCHVVHYSLARGHQPTTIIPYNFHSGCILARHDRKDYLAVSLSKGSTGLPGIERHNEHLKITIGCLLRDEWLLGLTVPGIVRSDVRLMKYAVTWADDQNQLSQPARSLCKMPKVCKDALSMQAYKDGTMIAVVVCTKNNISVVKLSDTP
ncbi:kinase-like protein [Aspergillus japonicus CBS 114.51]|uniref:Kinase-like protein n=1 Tax=Aspergillus japonicus CBS 114.51 TaxID=1448312 RepID=A0A8T8X121_ASPJA|nr:kinase-like protein [Aspergillus japonicus CBS 114.51]RAH81793.1 kinase-like protein [Aspergillus japonicus CBS 114.51]